MKILLITIVFLLAITLLSCYNNRSILKKYIKLVHVAEKQMLLDLKDVQLIDVRTLAEYEKGHINNSQNIDYYSPTFIQDVMHLDKDKPVILYCQKGGRSAKAAKKMHKSGFKNIYDLEGGFLKWQSEKLDLKLTD